MVFGRQLWIRQSTFVRQAMRLPVEWRKEIPSWARYYHNQLFRISLHSTLIMVVFASTTSFHCASVDIGLRSPPKRFPLDSFFTFVCLIVCHFTLPTSIDRNETNVNCDKFWSKQKSTYLLQIHCHSLCVQCQSLYRLLKQKLKSSIASDNKQQTVIFVKVERKWSLRNFNMKRLWIESCIRCLWKQKHR